MTADTSSAGSRIEEPPDDSRGRLVACRPEELRLHPSYIRHNLAVDASQLSAVSKLGELAFREPLAITQDGIILDGAARWKVACLQGRATLECIQYQMSETESLQYLLQRHRRSKGMNDFTRICLALELESSLRANARAKQQAGGQNKGSSILTKAGRLDVRQEIADIAGVSVGNVTKVKQLMATAHSDIITALRSKELSIHRAWSWSKLSPEEQREELWQHQSKRGIGKTIRTLVSTHQSKSSPTVLSLGDLMRLLSALHPARLDAVRVVPIKLPRKVVFVTEELFRTLEAQEELALTCATNSQ